MQYVFFDPDGDDSVMAEYVIESSTGRIVHRYERLPVNQSQWDDHIDSDYE